MRSLRSLHGTGLGLRRTHLGSLQDEIPQIIDFFEIAPENWLDVGGRLGHALRDVTTQKPLVCHGLLLNLGGPDPIDRGYLGRVKRFLDEHDVVLYSEHLSFCGAEGLLYELLPIPFTEEAVRHVATRIALVQNVLERRIAIENASYYMPLATDLDELTFVKAVLAEADCDLLLDINNVYVNSVNHRYDPAEFVDGLAGTDIAYAHIAGHSHDAPDLIVDTHGTGIIDPVWSLLEHAFDQFGTFPTLLERDQNIPPLTELLPELERIHELQHVHGGVAAA